MEYSETRRHYNKTRTVLYLSRWSLHEQSSFSCRNDHGNRKCMLLNVLHRVGLLACFILLWQHVALIFSSLNLIINQQASILDNKFLHLLDRSTHRSPRRPRTITDRTRRRRLANIGSARNRGTLRRPSYRLERTLALHRSSPTMTLCPSG